MGSFIVAIPSYRRADKQITLEYLSRMGMPKERIYIFVQTGSDLEAYSKYEGLANIRYAPADGVSKARNNILNELAERANLLMIDDDISCISRLRNEKLVPINSLEEFESTIEKCFSQSAKGNASMFGVYPVYNEFFMSNTISTAVSVVCVLGFPKGFKFRFDETFKTKEDIELCVRILSLKGKVFRYNFLAANAKHRTNAGGCYEIWHSDENAAVAKRLSGKYPQMLAVNKKNPSEVRMLLKDVKIQLGRKDIR